MKNSLEIFQKHDKAGKITSFVVFVLSCVVALAMLVGVIVLLSLGTKTITWNKPWARGGSVVIEEWFAGIGVNQNYHTIIGLHLGLMVIAVCEGLLSFKMFKFFKAVIAEGVESVCSNEKYAKTLAIFNYVLPGGSIVLSFIGMFVMRMIWSDVMITLSVAKWIIYCIIFALWIALSVVIGIKITKKDNK